MHIFTDTLLLRIFKSFAKFWLSSEMFSHKKFYSLAHDSNLFRVIIRCAEILQQVYDTVIKIEELLL